MYVNSYFESLFKGKMEEKTKDDRIQGSLILMKAKAIKAQINTILLTMKRDYLVIRILMIRIQMM